MSVKMEHRHCVLRAHLDELEYRYPLSLESVPLVEKLLADLVKTTESLQHYKNVAQSAIEVKNCYCRNHQESFVFLI